MFESAVKLIEAASASQLALAATLSIGVGYICFRFFRSAPVWARLLSFFGVMIFSFALAIRLIAPPEKNEPAPKNATQEPPTQRPIDEVNLATRLRAIQPPSERLPICLFVTSEPRCTAILALIADLDPVPVSAAVQQQLQSGPVTAPVAAAIAASEARQPDRVIAIGRSSGWRIDIFWCGGPNAGENRSNAERAAERLATAGPGTIPDISGAIRIRELENGRRGYPQPGTGLWASVDQMEGKAQAVEAITSYLGDARGRYQMRRTGSRLEGYISLFQCS